MSIRNFDRWLSTFRESINGFNYYTDFEKVYKNAAVLRDEINILNLLIGRDDIETEFERLITKYPDCLKAVPILLAVRGYELYCQDETLSLTYRFDNIAQTPEQYTYFMRKTGLFNMLQKHIIANLNDYVTGVEVGLDSNGRKNRGGHQMEHLVENYLKRYGIPYSREVTNEQLAQDFGLTLPAGFTHNKRWDFAIKTPRRIFTVETNFYTAGGSKLNETARSYRLIAEHAKTLPGFTFIWITDGKGWHFAANSLHETFNVLDTLYNIADLESGALHALLTAHKH